MPVYRLFTPSLSEFTLIAPSEAIAATAAALLSTDTGLCYLDGPNIMPPAKNFTRLNWEAIADALDSVLIGTRTKTDRRAFDELRSRMAADEWRDWLAVHEDECRTSSFDWSQHARDVAAKLRREMSATRSEIRKDKHTEGAE